MKTLPSGRGATDRWGNFPNAGKKERRLKIGFTGGLFPSLFLALPFLAIAYLLTGDISQMLQEIDQRDSTAPAATAAAQADVSCETANSADEEACSNGGAFETSAPD